MVKGILRKSLAEIGAAVAVGALSMTVGLTVPAKAEPAYDCSGPTIEVPDPILKAEILRKLNTQATDVPSSAAGAIEYISLVNTQMSSLEGLQCFPNLRQLIMFRNQVSDLSPLAELVNLTSINFGTNQISDLTPLAGLTHLQTLDVYGNSISDLSPIKKISGLESLNVRDNQIPTLEPLRGMSGLVNLLASNNLFTSIDVVASLPHLQSLWLDQTQVSDLSPVAQLHDLEVLFFSSTKVTDLAPIANLTKVRILGFIWNNISDITPLQGMTGIRNLDMRGNQISDLTPLSGLTDISIIHAEGNRISDLSALVKLNLSMFSAENQRINVDSSVWGIPFVNPIIEPLGHPVAVTSTDPVFTTEVSGATWTFHEPGQRTGVWNTDLGDWVETPGATFSGIFTQDVNFREVIPTAPTQISNTVTVPDLDGVIYSESEVGLLFPGDIKLSENKDSLIVQATPDTWYYFPADVDTEWTFHFIPPTPSPPSGSPSSTAPSASPSVRQKRVGNSLATTGATISVLTVLLLVAGTIATVAARKRRNAE